MGNANSGKEKFLAKKIKSLLLDFKNSKKLEVQCAYCGKSFLKANSKLSNSISWLIENRLFFVNISQGNFPNQGTVRLKRKGRSCPIQLDFEIGWRTPHMVQRNRKMTNVRSPGFHHDMSTGLMVEQSCSWPTGLVLRPTGEWD